MPRPWRSSRPAGGREEAKYRPARRDHRASLSRPRPRYIASIAATAGRAVALDPDTYTSAESHGIALLAAGAGIDAVELVMNAERQAVRRRRARDGASARPPCRRSRAMGFCLFNNIAVAAAHARAKGAARVAIVDYDVHHGNGTQHIFEADPNVLYVSLHQFPFYPGTGAADEIGSGAGKGFTVNLPLEVGSVDEDYRVAFSEVVVPVLGSTIPTCCSCRPASTRTSAIRSPACG